MMFPPGIYGVEALEAAGHRREQSALEIFEGCPLGSNTHAYTHVQRRNDLDQVNSV